MDKWVQIQGQAACIPIDNLDTDQIMPKQFLHGIDKSGLARGVLHDMRFDEQGQARPEFVLNRPDYANTRILVAGANFGCGSSREHAVWGLQQYGIQAIIAPSFGEIFYSNAMNNRLLLVPLPAEQIDKLTADAQIPGSSVALNIATLRIKSQSLDATFTLSPRHQQMFLEGLDVIGLTLKYQQQIELFAANRWQQQPWLKDIAASTRQRLSDQWQTT